jgi:hypothetical protein
MSCLADVAGFVGRRRGRFILRQAQDEVFFVIGAMKGLPHAEPVEARTTLMQRLLATVAAFFLKLMEYRLQ